MTSKVVRKFLSLPQLIFNTNFPLQVNNNEKFAILNLTTASDPLSSPILNKLRIGIFSQCLMLSLKMAERSKCQVKKIIYLWRFLRLSELHRRRHDCDWWTLLLPSDHVLWWVIRPLVVMWPTWPLCTHCPICTEWPPAVCTGWPAGSGGGTLGRVGSATRLLS